MYVYHINVPVFTRKTERSSQERRPQRKHIWRGPKVKNEFKKKL